MGGDVGAAAVVNARDRWRLERRLDRIGRRADVNRGTGINLSWLHWFDLWGRTFEELHGPDCWRLVAAGVDLYSGTPPR